MAIPGVPTISSVVGNAVGQLRCSWGSVSGATTYELEWCNHGDGQSWSTTITGITNLYYDLGSLDEGASHIFHIRARNAEGASAWSTRMYGFTWRRPGGQGQEITSNWFNDGSYEIGHEPYWVGQTNQLAESTSMSLGRHYQTGAPGYGAKDGSYCLWSILTANGYWKAVSYFVNIPVNDMDTGGVSVWRSGSSSGQQKIVRVIYTDESYDEDNTTSGTSSNIWYFQQLTKANMTAGKTIKEIQFRVLAVTTQSSFYWDAAVCYYVFPAPILSTPASGTIRVTRTAIDPETGGTALTYWYVEYASDSSFTQDVGNSGDRSIGSSFWDHSGLTGGDTWYYRIRYKNAVGYADNYMQYASETVLEVPDAPADPTIVADGIGDLGVQSSSPPDGGTPLTDVRHQISLSPTFSTGNITWTKGSAPSSPQYHQFTGLGNGAGPYYARAQYYNAIGWGNYNASPYNSATTWNVPSTSADPTLLPDGVGKITAFKPSSPADNGSAITHWQVQFDNDSGFGSIDYSSGDVLIAFSVDQATGLSNGVLYYAQVRFKNAVGYGAWSVGTVNATTWDVPDAPADPTIVADGVGDLTVTQTTLPNDGGESLDNVEFQIDDNTSFNDGSGRRQTWIKGSAPSEPQSHQFTGCIADILYYCRARYNNTVGWGGYNTAPYNSDRVWDQSNAPAWAAPPFTGRTINSIDLDWETPTDLGNSNLIEYHYRWRIVGGSYATVDTNSTNTYATKGSLAAGTQYQFRVRAMTEWGTGELNTADTHWTLCATVAKPTVTVQSAGVLRVSWGNVTGGVNYRIRRDNTTILTSSDAGTPYDDNTVVGGTSYVYDIQVQNADGNWNTYSVDSDPVTAVDIPDVCSAPTEPQAENVGALTVTRPSVPAGNGDGPDGWRIYHNVDSYVSIQKDNAVGVTEWEFTDLGNATTRYYKVAFYNDVGEAAQSPASPAGITWNVPGFADPKSATKPEASMIRITKNDTNPDPGGGTPPEPIDTWSVWRASSGGGSYSEIASDIIIDIESYYDDWSVDGGETWYYKTKYKNLVGDGALSTNWVSATADKIEVSKTSDSRIKREPMVDVQRVSESRIKRVAFDEMQRVSNSRILNTYEQTRDSDSRIKNTMETTTTSVSRIKRFGFEITRVSGSRIIHRVGLEKPSDSRIKKTASEVNRVSNSRILFPGMYPKYSDSRIKREGFADIQTPSDSRIQIPDNEITRDSDSRIAVRTPIETLSDSRIKNTMTTLERNSDSRLKNTMPLIERDSISRIHKLDNEITTLSDSVIQKTTRMTRSSDSKIIRVPQLLKISNSRILLRYNSVTRDSDSRIGIIVEKSKLSDSRLKKLDNELTKPSNSRITILDNELTRISDTRITKSTELTKGSDSRIKNTTELTRLSNSDIQIPDNELTKDSDSRLQKTFELTRTSDSTIRALRGNLIATFVKVRRI